MKIFYFTGTGNSLSIAKQMGGKLFSIPLMLAKGELSHEDDAIGLVFPCYYFNIPAIVNEFVSRASLSANYFFAVMTYGNTSGLGLEKLKKTAKLAGIGFHYTNEILMTDNFLPAFDIKKQIALEGKKEIEKNTATILNDIKYRKVNSVKKKGILTRIVAAVVSKTLSLNGQEDKNFRVDKSCISCGTCLKVCPRSNIISVDGKPTYRHKCEYCLSCIHACPITAIHIKGEKNSARFRNKNVSLEEIINSNSAIELKN